MPFTLFEEQRAPLHLSMLFFVISTASPFVLNQKAKNTAILCRRHYAGRHFSYTTCIELSTSTDDFSVKEAAFNLKLTKCMQIPAATLIHGYLKIGQKR